MTGRRQSRKTLRTDTRALLERCPGCNSRLAARRITRFLDRELEGAGFGTAQLGLMAQIAVLPDDTMATLLRRSGLEQSTLSRNLRALEAAGLVEIAVVEADLRRRAVWLTEAGARRLEAALPAWRAALARLAAHLRPGLARRLAKAAEVLAGD